MQIIVTVLIILNGKKVLNFAFGLYADDETTYQKIIVSGISYGSRNEQFANTKE